MPNLFKRWDGSNWITIFDDTRANAVLSITTNWGAYGTPFNTPKVNLVGGRAYLAGLIKNVAAGAFTSGTFATVPVGYRPPTQQLFYTICNATTGTCRVDVTPAGAITLSTIPAVTINNGGWITVDGLNWSIS